MAGGLPDEHKQQVHGSMAVTGLNSWHFFSFFPGLQPFHLIVHRDAYTNKLSASLDQFLIDYAASRSAAIPKLSLT
jgi:exosortase/archaeosortase